MTDADRPILLIGAGLAGSLMATLLARRGHRVEVFERRPDLRNTAGSAGRSINLALSTRGIEALAKVGIDQQILASTLPMTGRRMHAVDGELSFQPYGQSGQAIRSVSRRGLNESLLTLAGDEPGVRMHFDVRCVDVDLSAPSATFEWADGSHETISGKLIIGSDGVFSAVRDKMMRRGRFNYEQVVLEHGYKELTIPPALGGGFRIAPDALHIWPRGDYMLIALPNSDGSFTVTLFQAFAGPEGLDELDRDPAHVQAFFERRFPDVLPHMPTLLSDWQRNPTSSLTTIRCAPFHHGKTAVLIGDAAHAVVPFYGQGMNAAFESAALFDALLSEHKGDLEAALPAFTQARKADADAIRQLALDNFMEMRAHVADPEFLRRKSIEKRLHAAAPDAFVPLYSMVTFSSVSYSEAVRRAAAQNRWLDGRLAAAHAEDIDDEDTDFIGF
ncbi:MAG: FAD-dependent monooxygenase, partial [Myxococcales bacterium]|nr:FAD-dependent monooxygenase [Myxococcales bacterium]